MNNYTNLTGREDLLESITTLKKELAAKPAQSAARWSRKMSRTNSEI